MNSSIIVLIISHKSLQEIADNAHKKLDTLLLEYPAKAIF